MATLDLKKGSAVWKDQAHLWKGYSGIVKAQPGGYVLHYKFEKFLKHYHNFNFRSTDVIIMGQPKTGTSWMQDVLWTLLNNPDCVETSEGIVDRSISLELDAIMQSSDVYEAPSKETFVKFLKEKKGAAVAESFEDKFPVEGADFAYFLNLADHMPDRRVFKVHMPLSLYNKDLLQQTKVVYIVRNPKDSLVSMYNFLKCFSGMQFQGSLDDLFELFITEKLPMHPFWTHVGEAWQLRNHQNLHFVFYEDMKKQPEVELKRLREFLDVGVSDEQILKIKEHISFSSTKKREEARLPESIDRSKGSLFRKGEAGDWKNHFSPEQTDKMNAWIRKNTAGLRDLPYDYTK